MTALFSRVRGKLEGYQVDVSPHDWRLPSSYSTSSRSGKVTVIPDSAIFRNALIPNSSVPGAPEGSLIYPDISHAAVHLALLESFRNLRHSAAELGIKSKNPQLPSYNFSEKPTRSSTFDGESDSEQWNLLIRLSITRFETWWTNIENVFNHATAYTHHAGDKGVVQLTKDYLPPLDVLLVWYSFMLEPDEYSKACYECNMPHLTQLCFPWPAIRDVINTETMTLTIPRPAENLFKTLTDQSADILQYIKAPPAYTEASILSPSIDFYALVKKQEPFFDNSHKLLWIRSPSLVGSLERSALAYLEAQSTDDLYFMSSETIPFGIDLIWRTHRLYPAQYWLFRQDSSDLAPPDQMTKQRPTIADKKLTSPAPNCSSLCCCWTCERIRDDLPSFSLPPKSPPSQQSSSSSDVAKAWNPEALTPLSSDQIRSIQDDLGFYHAVDSARKQGLSLPTRSQTPKEKEAEKREKQRREEAGRLPGLNEYVEIGKDGKRNIKVSKFNRPTYGMSMV